MFLRRREAWTGFFTAMFPDADVAPSPFSAEFYISQHRGLTHSFVLLPLWALALAAVASLRRPRMWKDLTPRERRIGFLRLLAVSALGVASHILLDWITSWGTMFLSPLSWRRFTLDWVFILDFVLSGLLLAGLAGTAFATRRGDGRGRWAARASLAAALSYVALCGFRHADALALVERLAPGPGVTRAAIAQPLSPDRWLLLADDGARITARYVDLGKRGREPGDPLREAVVDGDVGRRGPLAFWRSLDALYRSPEELSVRTIPKANGPLAQRSLTSGVDGIFGRFARFPAAREAPAAAGGVEVTVRDARFGYLDKRMDPFTYVVRYDAVGNLVWSGFPSGRWTQSK